jgi:hypothetical protein
MCVGGPARQAAKVASQAENGLNAPPAFADPPSLLNERLALARETGATCLRAAHLSGDACESVIAGEKLATPGRAAVPGAADLVPGNAAPASPAAH